jgi:murein DD-endopeptidase MepM/ murein hydrolase activator NlpD
LAVGGAALAALVTVIAAAAPSHEASLGEPSSLGDAFESVTRTAATVEVEPPDWFPVQGVIDFGEADARFGAWRGGHRHEGQDVFAAAGTPIVSIHAGRVVEKGNDGGRGNYVAIWSQETDRTFVYLHMRAPTAHRVGDRVDAGARVGAVGCTGSCWGDHLHLEMREGSGTTAKPLDPMPLLGRLARRARFAASTRLGRVRADRLSG